MTSRIHVSLPVRDLQSSVEFYSTLLGHAPSKRKVDYANFRLDEPPIHLSLIPGDGSRGEHEHFGIEVHTDDELASFRSRLDEAGVAMRLEENETCCYAVSDKVWVADPDGRPWEVWIRRADAESMSEPATSSEPNKAESACCVATGCC